MNTSALATRCKPSGRFNISYSNALRNLQPHADIDECSTNSHSCDINAVGKLLRCCKTRLQNDVRACIFYIRSLHLNM